MQSLHQPDAPITRSLPYPHPLPETSSIAYHLYFTIIRGIMTLIDWFYIYFLCAVCYYDDKISRFSNVSGTRQTG